eukprot:gene19428-biopygen23487
MAGCTVSGRRETASFADFAASFLFGSWVRRHAAMVLSNGVYCFLNNCKEMGTASSRRDRVPGQPLAACLRHQNFTTSWRTVYGDILENFKEMQHSREFSPQAALQKG